MNFCVYGAASDKIDRKYIDAVEELGRQLGERGHTLVFGGGGVGVMGAAARGVHAGGGKVTAVIPRFFKDQGIEDLYEKCDDYIYTYTLSERKTIMEDNSNAFIIGPGGIGTYDEFFETLTLKQLGLHNKPIAILNVDGFYDSMFAMMQHADNEKFFRPGVMEMFGIFNEPNKLIQYLENSLEN